MAETVGCSNRGFKRKESDGGSTETTIIGQDNRGLSLTHIFQNKVRAIDSKAESKEQSSSRYSILGVRD